MLNEYYTKCNASWERIGGGRFVERCNRASTLGFEHEHCMWCPCDSGLNMGKIEECIGLAIPRIIPRTLPPTNTVAAVGTRDLEGGSGCHCKEKRALIHIIATHTFDEIFM